MNDDTLLVHAGRDPARHDGTVNPPVHHASTVLFRSVDDLFESVRKPFDRTVYGSFGVPVTFALEDAMARLEGGHRTVAVRSGKAAIATVMLALAKPGDHLLVADTAYGPTRRLCEDRLAPLGVETTFYDPAIGAGIARLIRPSTCLVYLESPGSLTFEVQDVPAIAAAARAAGVLVVMDNTWATPLFFKPLAHGADISIQAGTKYIGGHSDVMIGLITTTEPVHEVIRRAAMDLGGVPGPDDCYLALRGLRTLAVRLERHQATALRLARWLQARPEVRRVLHPALPGDPGHALWRRDFKGATGLFGFVLQPCSKAALSAMLDHMELFGLGYSWGGFESLLIPVLPQRNRSATAWDPGGPTLRLHAGLEDPADLEADLAAGFARLAAAS